MTTTVGIDLAVQERATAVCTIDWDGRLASFSAGSNERLPRLLQSAADGSWTAIDIPLGWPTDFSRAVQAYMSHEPWPESTNAFSDSYPGLRLRATDLWLEWTMARDKLHPISVSADKLGAPAMRAAWLLSQAQLHSMDRSDPATHKIVEVYPKAAMVRWGIPTKGYKSGEQAERNRQEIIRQLEREAGVNFSADAAALSHDEVDALVAALVARAAECGHVITRARAEREWSLEPGPPNVDFSRAATEGWIHIPCECGLKESVSGRPCPRSDA